MDADKCEFKHSRRSVRWPGKKGFLGLKGLSEDYTEDAIKERIAGLRSAPKKKLSADVPAPQQEIITPKERKFIQLAH